MTHTPVTESELIAEATGMRVTLEQIEDTIASEHYFTAANGVLGANITQQLEEYSPVTIYHVPPTAHGRDLGLLTFCVLRLKNGYTVTGQSACADPLNFNPEIGQRIARQDATRRMWPLLGYELKTELAKLYRH